LSSRRNDAALRYPVGFNAAQAHNDSGARAIAAPRVLCNGSLAN
jgi:hypothetical protein